MNERAQLPFIVALVDLDGQTVPDWVRETLEREAIELIVHDCRSRAELAEHAANADVVWLFGGSRILMDGNVDAVGRCRAIVRTGSGTDNVPVDEASRRGIVVANTPAALADAVSDHAIALLFTVVRRIAALDRDLRRGRWAHAEAAPSNSLVGRTLGLVGFGHIARQVARKLSGFEMRVLAHDPFVGGEEIAARGGEPAELNDLISAADFVSLHCPLTPRTRHLIGREQLGRMKRTAVLINTSRGGVVDQSALVQALQQGRIAGAGLDVFETEPLPQDDPLLQLENVVLTPHCASMSADGMEPRWRASVETLVTLARGECPQSCVNREVFQRAVK